MPAIGNQEISIFTSSFGEMKYG